MPVHFSTPPVTPRSGPPRTTRTVLLASVGALLLSSLLACIDPGDRECGGAFAPAPPPWEPGLVGHESLVVLSPTLPVRCNGQLILPEAVTVQVTDSRTQPVEATAELDPSTGLATIRFTPRETGVHRVVALFEPRGGRDQRDVPVGVDRSAEPFLDLPRSCYRPLSISAEAIVCDGQLLRRGLPIGAALELRDTPSSLRTAAGDGHLWHLEEGRLRVWRDDGVGELIPLLDHQLEAADEERYIECLAAQGSRAFIYTETSRGVARLRFLELGPEGALLPERQAFPSSGTAGGTRCFLSGDDAILVRSPLDRTRDSEVLYWPYEDGSRAPVEVKVPGTIFDLDGRHLISGTLLGTGPGARLRLSAHSISEAGAISAHEHVFVAPGTRVLNLRTFSEVPSTGIRSWVVTQRERRLQLEYFADGLFGGSRHHVCAPDGSGGTRIWER